MALNAGMTSRLVSRDEHKLAVREFGRDLQGNGPTIVAMHGFPDNSRLYDEIAPLLASSHHFVAFDLLGWGDSDKPRGFEYGFRELDADLDAVLKALELQSYVLIAHDISAPAAIDRAAQDPRVLAVVLLNSVEHSTELVTAPEAIQTFSTPGLSRDVQRFFARRFAGLFRRQAREQISKFMVRGDDLERKYVDIFVYQLAGSRDAFFDLNDELQSEFDERRRSREDRLAQIETPVFLVFGDLDPYLRVEAAQELREFLPNATFEVIEGGGHFVQIDRAEAVAAAVRGAIAQASGSPAP
ncbi:MAG: alpha/beta fold hydrolase [Phycisphaerales bacterium]